MSPNMCSPCPRLSVLCMDCGTQTGNLVEVKAMKNFFGVFLGIAVIAIASAHHSAQTLRTTKDDEKAQTAIRAVLDAQREAWNHGDIEGYMDGYDRSPN